MPPEDHLSPTGFLNFLLFRDECPWCAKLLSTHPSGVSSNVVSSEASTGLKSQMESLLAVKWALSIFSTVSWVMRKHVQRTLGYVHSWEALDWLWKPVWCAHSFEVASSVKMNTGESPIFQGNFYIRSNSILKQLWRVLSAKMCIPYWISHCLWLFDMGIVALLF